VNDLPPFLDWMHRSYPRQALVMTEFGAEATMNGPATVKETYAFQAAFLRRYLDIVEKRPFLSGAIYWTLREFAVKPEWDGGAERTGIARDSIHNKGLLRYGDGTPKPAWSIAASDFGKTAMYTTATPRAVAASLDEVPVRANPSTTTIAVTAAILGALLLLTGVLLWALRGVWRHGDRPAPPIYADPEPGERRLRAVA
jgi:beta-glucuronidase